MSQTIAQQWMRRRRRRRRRGAGAVTEFLNFLAAGQGDHRTQQARERGGVLGVALTVCVHIWINYCFHETSVRPGQAMELAYQFQLLFLFLQFYSLKEEKLDSEIRLD